MFLYSDSNKRYHTLDYFYKHKFGCKVFKISLNGGFSCPNVDGTLGTRGCIYCSPLGSGEFAGKCSDDLVKQFNDIKTMMNNKWSGKYIGYFQARTNTYAPVSVLKEKYETILKMPDVVGLSIATRPDCISNECLDYLSDLNKRTFLTVELGLQSIHDSTNRLINRCHTLDCFTDMVCKLRERNINVVVLIINGLPYETREMMLDTVRFINKLDIQGVKIHMLHIVRNTDLARMYMENPFHVLTRDEYVSIVCDQLELLRPSIVINRITGDPDINELIEPKWLVKKFCVLNDIDKEMVKRDIYQGDKV